MGKRIAYSLFILLITFTFIVILYDNTKTGQLYLLSFISLILGWILLLPTNKRTDTLMFFLIISYSIVILFNLINLLFLKKINEGLALFNYILSLFGFFEYSKQLKIWKN